MPNKLLKNSLLLLNFIFILISLFYFNKFFILYIIVFLAILFHSLKEVEKTKSKIINHQIAFNKIEEDKYEIKEQEISNLGSFIKRNINDFNFWYFSPNKDILLTSIQMEVINEKLKKLNNLI
jgi:hypothetical protein